MNELEDIPQYPDGWEDGLTSDEFLSEAKAMLRKKFDSSYKQTYLSDNFFDS